MRCLLYLVVAVGMVTAHWGYMGVARGAGALGPPLAGWYKAFADLPGYQRTFLLPVRSTAHPGVYQQTARYMWTGDADRRWEVTLARDPAFARRYSVAAMQRASLSPRPVRVGTAQGWLWDCTTAPTCGETRQPLRLVLLLTTDRVVSLEGRGLGPWDDPVALVSRFDLRRVVAVLAAPPRTHFGRSLAAFRVLKAGDSFADVTAWVGMPDAEIGSGIHVLVYRLDDGSRVLLGFPDFQHLLYVTYQRRDGSVESLAP